MYCRFRFCRLRSARFCNGQTGRGIFFQGQCRLFDKPAIQFCILRYRRNIGDNIYDLVVTAILRLLDVLQTENILGECAVWNAETSMFWWTDIQSRLIFCYDPATGAIRRFATPDRLCSFAFVAASSRLIAAFAHGVAYFDPATGATEWLYRLPPSPAGVRFNDGRTDRDGRFWTGTMAETGIPSDPPPARLYCVGSDGSVSVHGDPVTVVNAIGTSPDGTQLYFSDMPQKTIFVCDLDRGCGRLSTPRVFVRIDGKGVPDGAAVDREGCVWNAHWGGGRVVCYTPAGRIAAAIEMPVSQPTCVAFGGTHMNLLFVTTARDALDRQTLAAQPEAGNVFIYETDAMGLADAQFVQKK